MEIVLHIGQQKTASTNIQHRLAELRPKLRDQNILYSYAFGKNKANRFKWTIQKPGDAGSKGKSEIENLQKEIDQNYDKLVISQETFFSVSPVTINLIQNILGTRRKVSIYVYLRPPLEHVLSYYQQKVNGFASSTLDEFIERVIQNKYYLYAAELDRWASAFGADAIHARVFTPERWSSPVENFLDWIGVDPAVNATPGRKTTRTRASLDPASTELLRSVNLFYERRPDLMSADFAFEFRDLVQAVKTGERLALNERQAATLRDSVAADLERLAGRYLPESDVAVLMRAPATLSPANRPVDGTMVMARAVDVLTQMEPRFPPETTRDELRAMLEDYGRSTAATSGDAPFADLVHHLASIGFSLAPASSSERSAEAIERRRQKLKPPKKLGRTGGNATKDLVRMPATPGAAATNGRSGMDQDQKAPEGKKAKERSPEEQAARAEKKARKEEKLAAMTPEQRAAKEEKRAERKKAKDKSAD